MGKVNDTYNTEDQAQAQGYYRIHATRLNTNYKRSYNTFGHTSNYNLYTKMIRWGEAVLITPPPQIANVTLSLLDCSVNQHETIAHSKLELGK